MTSLRINLLGGFEAHRTSGAAVSLPTKKTQALLAYLALHPGQAHGRDALASLLWGDTDDAHARRSLRQAVYSLRKALPPARPPILVLEHETVALNAAAIAVDVAELERLVTKATPDALEQAAALYRGDLLHGFTLDEAPFEEWLFAERERLRELALGALAKLLAAQSASGATEPAIRTAVRLLALDPLQEIVHRTLMRLYARQGRRGAALRQYQICLGVLQRELGAEPETETKRVYQEVLQQRSGDAEQTGAVRAPASARVSRPAIERPALPFAAEPSVETILVGRDAEMARLREALDEAARRHGKVVMVVGEAGIGKTSLLRALAAEAIHRDVRILLGRSYESEQILPFAPWIDAFRTAQVTVDEDVLSALAPVWRAELGRLFPEVAVPGLPMPSDDQRRLFEGVAQLVEHVAAVQPLALLLEDVHWADEMSVRLLSFLGRRVKTWPVLVVASAREEELADAAGLRRALDELRREGHFALLPLPPLSVDDTAALVRSLTRAGKDAEAVARLGERVWRLSEGNPFVVVETLRALADASLPSGAIVSLTLPESVRGVIASRLERLSDRARELAAVAAVIGREFDFTLLQRAAALGEAEAAEALEELVRRRIVHSVGERFDFTHDRIREVAYRELLTPRRKWLHAQVATALDDLNRGRLEPHYAALALHAREGEQWDRAAQYLYLAGRQALAYGNYGQARPFFEGAAEAVDRGAADRTVKLDAYLELWVAAIEGGTVSDLAVLEPKVDALACVLHDRPRLAQWRVRQAQALWNVWDREGALASAVERARDALTLAPDDDLRTRGYAHFIAAAASADLGRLDEAIAEFDAGASLFAMPATDPVLATDLALPIYVSLVAWRSAAEASRGDFDAAFASAREALAVADRIGGHPARAFARAFLGRVHLQQGEFERARPLLAEGLAIGEEYALVHGIVLNGLYLGYCEVMLGHAAGVARLERALGAGASIGTIMTTWTGYGGATAATYRAAGRVAEADVEVARGLALATLRGAQAQLPSLLRQRAEIRLAQGQAAEAVSDGQHALQLSADMGLRPEQARCHLMLGELHRAAADRDRARHHFGSARESLRALGMRHWLAEAEAALAAVSEPRIPADRRCPPSDPGGGSRDR